jgi:hypothetical protein
LKLFPCSTLFTVSFTTTPRRALDHSLGVIHPEKVTVQNSLHNAGQHSSPLKPALGKVPVYPVRDIQASVYSQRKQVMRRYSLGLACSLQHEKLREDSYAFQPYRKRPEDLRNGVFYREEDGKQGGAAEEVGDAEGVELRIVGGPVVIEHDI